MTVTQLLQGFEAFFGGLVSLLIEGDPAELLEVYVTDFFLTDCQFET